MGTISGKTFRFRTPRATSSNSTVTVVELHSLEELAAHLTTIFLLKPIAASDLEIFPCHTDVYGWHNHMVSVQGRFIAGFTDRQVAKQ
jgi:hypothetical protein